MIRQDQDAPAASSVALSGAARLWAPWAALAGLAAVALGLAVWLAAEGLQAWRHLQAREQALSALQALVGADRPSESPPATTPLPADATVLLAEVEALAAASGSRLLQFLPEPLPATADADLPRPVRLRVQGPTGAVERFLLDLADAALALEFVALRLSAAATPGEVLGELGLRLHGGVAALAAANALASPSPWLDPPAPTEGMPEGLFGEPPAPPVTPALAPAKASAAAPATRQEDAASPPAGLRLVGILRHGERIAALLDLPGGGAHLLRPGERLTATVWQLERVGAAEVTLSDGRGGRHTFGLATLAERRP